MVADNPLPPTPSPLRSEGKPNKIGSENVIYTRTTLEIWNKIKPFARQMRHDSTPAEDALWQQLRRKNLVVYKLSKKVI